MSNSSPASARTSGKGKGKVASEKGISKAILGAYLADVRGKKRRKDMQGGKKKKKKGKSSLQQQQTLIIKKNISIFNGEGEREGKRAPAGEKGKEDDLPFSDSPLHFSSEITSRREGEGRENLKEGRERRERRAL